MAAVKANSKKRRLSRPTSGDVASEPLISVIMPAYNAMPFIGSAIESILHQTYQHIELIIIDDGSADGTTAIAKKYAKTDKRIIYHHQPNGGEYSARNKGLNLSKGDYICWLDADDISLPQRLEKQLRFLQQRPPLTMVGCGFATLVNNRVQPQPIKATPILHTLTRMESGAGYTYNNFMFSRRLLKKIIPPYFRPLPIGTDIDFLLRALLGGVAAYNLADILYYYRQHDQQVTRASDISFLAVAAVYYNFYYQRDLGGPDLLAQFFRQHDALDKNNVIDALLLFLPIANIRYHRVFIQRLMIRRIKTLFGGQAVNKKLWAACWRHQPKELARAFLFGLWFNLIRFFIYKLRGRYFFFD